MSEKDMLSVKTGIITEIGSRCRTELLGGAFPLRRGRRHCHLTDDTRFFATGRSDDGVIWQMTLWV
jgi:hypothetical protein